jgi:cation:H+ antiporter
MLTAAQSLLAVVLLLNLRMSTIEAGALALLFFSQFLTPHSLVPRDVFSIMYVALAAIFGLRQVIEMRPFVSTRLARPPA